MLYFDLNADTIGRSYDELVLKVMTRENTGPRPIGEPDWKRFKPLRQLAIERFCNGVLQEAAAITATNERTAHERYRGLYQLMDERDKEIVQLFDPYTRSRAVMQLVGLCQMWLVTEDELTVFSDDLQKRVRSLVTLFGHPEKR